MKEKKTNVEGMNLMTIMEKIKNTLEDKNITVFVDSETENRSFVSKNISKE